jgi:hypothetical protein
MTRFVQETISDLRAGRESWRVLLAVSLPSVLASLALCVMRTPG